MPPRRSRRGRHGKDGQQGRGVRHWGRRLPVALGLAVLGYFGVTASFANVAVKSDPERAHALAPNNGVVTAAHASGEFLLQPTPDERSEAARLARLALLQDGTAVEALTVLGFQAQLRGDEARADRIFELGTKLSRRELRPQLWAIEEAVSRGDIRDALRHYDIALRTSSAANNILLPILVSAIAEPKVRASLFPIMATRPVWADAFIAYAASSPSNPQAVVQFFREGQSLPLPVDDNHRAALVNALYAQGAVEDAWAYYQSFRSGAVRSPSRDPRFSLDAATRTPFDWQTATGTSLSAAILSNEGGGLLDFAVPPSTGGLIASQVQLLPPGTYRLTGRSTGIEQPEQSRPYWLLSCADGRELGRIVVPNSAEAQGQFGGRYVVPRDCPVQTLALIARSSNDIAGVSGQITMAQLTPAGDEE